MAIQGGCSWIQLRMKDGIYEDTVRTCATICAEECERIVDFCVNDDLETAQKDALKIIREFLNK
jgi:thiamine-phosphate pyrophosphorylase